MSLLLGRCAFSCTLTHSLAIFSFHSRHGKPLYVMLQEKVQQDLCRLQESVVAKLIFKQLT